MKPKKPKTVGHITRAISRAFRQWKKHGKHGGETPRWFDIAKRHIESFARSQGKSAKISGPYGICRRISVQIGRKWGQFEVDNYDGWRLGKRDWSITLTEFRHGSIGEINGMNHPYSEIPNSTPLADLFK